MRRQRRLSVLATFGAIAASALAACGDDEPERDPEADQALVDSAVLTVDDLPDGWAEVPVEDDEDAEGIQQCIESELGITSEAFDAARTARSDRMQFELDQQAVRARVNAFEDGDIPGRVIDAIDEEGLIACATESFGPELEAPFELAGIEAIDPVVGDETTAYQLRVLIRGSGVSIESRVNAIQVDRFVVTLDVTGLEGSIDDQLVVDGLETMIGRVEDGDN